MILVSAGSLVRFRDANGRWHRGRACGQPRSMGHNFEGVPVCSEEEWVAAQREKRRPETIHWPVGDVTAELGEPKHFIKVWDGRRYQCDCGEKFESATDFDRHAHAAKTRRA